MAIAVQLAAEEVFAAGPPELDVVAIRPADGMLFDLLLGLCAALVLTGRTGGTTRACDLTPANDAAVVEVSDAGTNVAGDAVEADVEVSMFEASCAMAGPFSTSGKSMSETTTAQ